MKIYNKIILKWNKEIQNYSDVVYEDSFEYTGPIMSLQTRNGPPIKGIDPPDPISGRAHLLNIKEVT